MKKRLLAALLAVCMVFALGTVSALATDEGFPDAGEGGVISLTKDITITGDQTLNLSTNSVETNGYSITVTGSLTVTGNGKVTNNVSPAKSDGKTDVKGIFIVDGGTLTIQQGNFETVGAEIIRVNSGTANVNGGTFKCTATDVSSFNERVMFLVTGADSKLNFSAGTIDADGFGSNSGHGLYGVYPANGATVVLGSSGGGNQPEIYTDFSAIALNNTTSNPATTVTINSGYYKSGLNGGSTLKENCVIYLPGECSFVINGGTFVTADTNANVISIPYPGFDVDLNINGGTFNASTGNAVIKTWGVKLNTANNATPNNVSISGGEFTSGRTFADFNVNEPLDDFITGGTFKTSAGVADTSVKYYIPDDVSMKVDETTGEVVVDDTTTVATVDGVGYPSLEKAIDAAEEGDKVELLKDVPLTDGLTISKNITIDGRNYDLTISGVTGDGIKITSGHTLTLANTDLKITGTTNTAGNFDGTGINAVGNLTLKNSDVVLEDLNKAIIANAGNNEIKLEDSTLTIDDIDGNASNGGKWTVDDSTVNISNVGNYGLSVYSLKTTGASELSFKNIGYGAIFAEQSIDIGGTTSVKINNAGSDPENNTIIFESDYGDCYAPIQLVVDKKAGLPSTGRAITFRSGTSISVVDSFDHNGDVYVDKGTKYVNNSGDYLSVKIVGNDVFMVTFVDDDDDFLFSYTVDKNDDITLPGRPYYSAREFIGWLCDEDHKIYEASDKYEDVDEDLEFKAVWEAADYDIVIDDDILHGDIWTSPKSEAEAGDTVHVYADPDAGYVLEDLSVTYRSGRNELKLTRVSANHYTFTMPAYDVYVTAEFTSDGFPFDDVRSNQWFYDAVYYVWANDLMEGVDYDEFNPNGTMTRAMFWAVLGRIDGETITGSDWADEARDWAMSEGVSDGTNPNGLVTREQMVTMLWRYAGERDGSGNLSRYTDGDKVAQYATEAMRWALGNGIIEGTTATTLEPQATATRAQCAAIFMRYYE